LRGGGRAEGRQVPQEIPRQAQEAIDRMASSQWRRMRTRFMLLLILFACFGLNCFSVAAQNPSALHTPAKGSAERHAIMDMLRDDFFKQTNQRVVFQVNHLKVHQGRAWV